MLLEAGADPNLVVISDDGMPLKTPLGEYLSCNTELDRTVIRLFLKFGAKIVLKSQFRDPHGILNCLENLSQDDELLRETLATAEDFDPPIIRRCAALSSSQKEYVLSLSRNPRSLKHQTRIFLRQQLGKELPKCVDKLDLPRILVQYLLFEIS